MITKPLFVIIATLIFVWSLWAGVLGACFEKNSASQTLIIIKIDKNSKGAEGVYRFFSDTFAAAGKLSTAVFSSVGGPELVRKCKEQPVLFGGLSIFFGVFACIIFVVVHHLRTAARF